MWDLVLTARAVCLRVSHVTRIHCHCYYTDLRVEKNPEAVFKAVWSLSFLFVSFNYFLHDFINLSNR